MNASSAMNSHAPVAQVGIPWLARTRGTVAGRLGLPGLEAWRLLEVMGILLALVVGLYLFIPFTIPRTMLHEQTWVATSRAGVIQLCAFLGPLVLGVAAASRQREVGTFVDPLPVPPGRLIAPRLGFLLLISTLFAAMLYVMGRLTGASTLADWLNWTPEAFLFLALSVPIHGMLMGLISLTPGLTGRGFQIAFALVSLLFSFPLVILLADAITPAYAFAVHVIWIALLARYVVGLSLMPTHRMADAPLSSTASRPTGLAIGRQILRSFFPAAWGVHRRAAFHVLPLCLLAAIPILASGIIIEEMIEIDGTVLPVLAFAMWLALSGAWMLSPDERDGLRGFTHLMPMHPLEFLLPRIVIMLLMGFLGGLMSAVAIVFQISYPGLDWAIVMLRSAVLIGPLPVLLGFLFRSFFESALMAAAFATFTMMGLMATVGTALTSIMFWSAGYHDQMHTFNLTYSVWACLVCHVAVIAGLVVIHALSPVHTLGRTRRLLLGLVVGPLLILWALPLLTINPADLYAVFTR